MATISERSQANNKRVGKAITDALKDIAPFVLLLEKDITETRKMPFTTPKQKQKLDVRLNAIVSEFLKIWQAQLLPTLQKHYKLSLNKDVKGAKEQFGEATQKRKFKKRENIKRLDLTLVAQNMERVIRSIPAVELAYHRRKLATNILFAKEAA